MNTQKHTTTCRQPQAGKRRVPTASTQWSSHTTIATERDTLETRHSHAQNSRNQAARRPDGHQLDPSRDVQRANSRATAPDAKGAGRTVCDARADRRASTNARGNTTTAAVHPTDVRQPGWHGKDAGGETGRVDIKAVSSASSYSQSASTAKKPSGRGCAPGRELGGVLRMRGSFWLGRGEFWPDLRPVIGAKSAAGDFSAGRFLDRPTVICRHRTPLEPAGYGRLDNTAHIRQLPLGADDADSFK